METSGWGGLPFLLAIGAAICWKEGETWALQSQGFAHLRRKGLAIALAEVLLVVLLDVFQLTGFQSGSRFPAAEKRVLERLGVSLGGAAAPTRVQML